jgi:hypothetical protein
VRRAGAVHPARAQPAHEHRQELGEALARLVGLVAEEAVLEGRDATPDADV